MKAREVPVGYLARWTRHLRIEDPVRTSEGTLVAADQ